MWTQTYKKAVTFSFDDGIFQDTQLVGLLNQYHLKATFNINTSLSMSQHHFQIQGINIFRLPLNQMIDLYRKHEVAVHTATHPDLTKLTDDEILFEIDCDIKTIETVFNQKPSGMAYPYGRYNDRVVQLIASTGLLYARTVDSNHQTSLQSDLLRFKPTCHYSDPNIMDIIETFLAYDGDEPQVLYIWGHSYEGDVDHNWDHIENVFRKISGHPDIFYGTNRDVLLPTAHV